MRKFKFFLTLGLLFILAGCSKNNTDDNPQNEIDKSGNLLDTGASANDLLANDNFTKLKIEIAFVTGFRPTPQAINDFVSYIKLHTFKADVELIYKELASPDEDSLTLQEIADLESENRTVYNDGQTLGMYIYFADAPSNEDDQNAGLVTLGAVYRNTSMVIHERTVQLLSNTSSFITIADIESATINHEFGHLMGLVNIGTPAIGLHEDSESPNHCNVPGCLMRAELQFTGTNRFSSILSKHHHDELKSSCSLNGKTLLKLLESRTAKGLNNAVPLDAECILDLQGNGGR